MAVLTLYIFTRRRYLCCIERLHFIAMVYTYVPGKLIPLCIVLHVSTDMHMTLFISDVCSVHDFAVKLLLMSSVNVIICPCTPLVGTTQIFCYIAYYA